jgi:transaldolase
MANFLEQLKSMTVVVSDTGDINAVKQFTPRDSTTNPSLIAAAALLPEYDALVGRAIASAKSEGKGESKEAQVKRAVDRLAVEFGLMILQIIPGRVSTEVDARLSYDTQGSVAKARQLIKMYEAAGVSRQRILIKLASSWEGIKAAEQLEQEGIHCNMTLLFGLHQAVASAEAKATLISPFVGRILDWYLKSTGKTAYAPAEDPGVVSVTKIYQYYKHFGYRTEIMGASFRNLGEILELAGCDLLTISPKLLGELTAKQGTLARKLDPAAAKAAHVERLSIDEATFRKLHEQDRMANDKLAEGVDGFTKSLVALEAQLLARL